MTVGGDLSSAITELARLDSSRLTYGQDYVVDLQVLFLCHAARVLLQ